MGMRAANGILGANRYRLTAYRPSETGASQAFFALRETTLPSPLALKRSISVRATYSVADRLYRIALVAAFQERC